MHAFPTYVALAALLVAGAALVRVSPAGAGRRGETLYHVDLRPLQEAWAWLRGRGRNAVRRELAATSYYLERVRALAEDVLRGDATELDAHAELMLARYPSVATRCACAEQLRAHLFAHVARTWVDHEWPDRLAAHRAEAAR